MFWPTVYHNNLNAFTELDRIQGELEQLFRGSTMGRREFPAVNVWTNNDDAVLTAELSGINPDNLEITVKDDTVTLKGERVLPELKEGRQYLRRERGQGRFTRSFALPFRVQADAVNARYRNGMLEIRLPRAEADKARRIAIKAS